MILDNPQKSQLTSLYQQVIIFFKLKYFKNSNREKFYFATELYIINLYQFYSIISFPIGTVSTDKTSI